MKAWRVVFSLALLAVAAGCTWVAVNPQAKSAGVIVLSQDRVSRCQLLGKVQVSVEDKVLGMPRVQSDVEHDLQNLAINQAVTAGGDTVSPLAAAVNGVQIFGLYKCLGTAAPTATTAPAASTAVKTIPYRPPSD